MQEVGSNVSEGSEGSDMRRIEHGCDSQGEQKVSCQEDHNTQHPNVSFE